MELSGDLKSIPATEYDKAKKAVMQLILERADDAMAKGGL